MAPALPRILCGSHATPQRAYALRAGPASAERSGLKRNTAHTPQSRASRNAHRSPPAARRRRQRVLHRSSVAATHRSSAGSRALHARAAVARSSRGQTLGGGVVPSPPARAVIDTQGAATRRRGDRRTAQLLSRCTTGAVPSGSAAPSTLRASRKNDEHRFTATGHGPCKARPSTLYAASSWRRAPRSAWRRSAQARANGAVSRTHASTAHKGTTAAQPNANTGAASFHAKGRQRSAG
ncbi:hypothetical protein ERJ75_001790100 [Trypanosoma vivax]|nr:hypothetical protein ERJ75_001790100 [Trypanosoma vivax]